MADTDQQVVMLGENSPTQTQCITENGEYITVTQGGEVVSSGVGEDILQQALDEASEGYENADVEYTTEAEGNIAVVADSNGTLSDANGVTYRYVTTNLPNASETQTVVTAPQVQPGQSLIRVAATNAVSNPRQVTVNPQQQNEVVTIPSTASVSSVLAAISTPAQDQGGVQQQIVQPQMVRIVQPHVIGQDMVQHPQQIVQQAQQSPSEAPQTLPQQTHVQLSQIATGTPGAITVLTNSGAGSEPLGSSGNPIRIIQQGNKYTSVQQLTAEQVAQIMQVVQQQQLAQSTSQGGGSSVLFNSQTQTRIVYRVIYPSELHAKSGGSPGSSGGVGTATITSSQGPKTITVPRQMVTLGGPKRTYKKRSREDEEKVDGPELSKEEKETKKKHRPRTRSGRVSRPPKHMVQDYKHIHHLDWEEDYDDSDGGYSDYHVSENEDGEGEEKHKEATYVSTGLGSSKPKNHNCEKCDKAYIGAAGLARHYRLNPDHGNPADVLPLIPASAMNSNGVDVMLNSGDESSTQDSFSSTASVPTSLATPSSALQFTAIPTPTTTSPPTTTPPPLTSTTAASPAASPAKLAPRGAIKAKQAYAQENVPARRKARLKELVRQCKNEELMEVVLPRLARVITLWEFLLMKVERGRPSRPHIADVLHEYELLNKHVGKMCTDNLVSEDEMRGVDKHRNVLQMTNRAIAEALGLNMGKYVIREAPKVVEPLAPTYKIISPASTASLTPSSSSSSSAENMKTEALMTSGGVKRKVQLVTPEEFLQLTKRPCTTSVRAGEPGITAVSQASGVVTLRMGNKLLSGVPAALPTATQPSSSSATLQPTALSNVKLKEALASNNIITGQMLSQRRTVQPLASAVVASSSSSSTSTSSSIPTTQSISVVSASVINNGTQVVNAGGAIPHGVVSASTEGLTETMEVIQAGGEDEAGGEVEVAVVESVGGEVMEEAGVQQVLVHAESMQQGEVIETNHNGQEVIDSQFQQQVQATAVMQGDSSMHQDVTATTVMQVDSSMHQDVTATAVIQGDSSMHQDVTAEVVTAGIQPQEPAGLEEQNLQGESLKVDMEPEKLGEQPQQQQQNHGEGVVREILQETDGSEEAVVEMVEGVEDQEDVKDAVIEMEQTGQQVVSVEAPRTSPDTAVVEAEEHVQLQEGAAEIQNGEILDPAQHSGVQEQQVVTHEGQIVTQDGQFVTQDGHIVTQDGQTVLFTNDGGQTYYQQNLSIEPGEMAPDVVQQQQQQQQPHEEIAIEGAAPQLVTMETPEGLVEGQLVTNADGSQFLIPVSSAAEHHQQVYQTPDGLILIQNPDGTLRIHNNGDQQIPLETVQALLAVDGEGQVHIEGSTIEQAT